VDATSLIVFLTNVVQIMVKQILKPKFWLSIYFVGQTLARNQTHAKTGNGTVRKIVQIQSKLTNKGVVLLCKLHSISHHGLGLAPPLHTHSPVKLLFFLRRRQPHQNPPPDLHLMDRGAPVYLAFRSARMFACTDPVQATALGVFDEMPHPKTSAIIMPASRRAHLALTGPQHTGNKSLW
jgi:hypothetical protein